MNMLFRNQDETNLCLYLENKQNGSQGYHHKYHIETLPQLQNNFQDEGLFVFTNDENKSDLSIIIKSVDLMGTVRDGEAFRIPKKSDILSSPVIHTRRELI